MLLLRSCEWHLSRPLLVRRWWADLANRIWTPFGSFHLQVFPDVFGIAGIRRLSENVTLYGSQFPPLFSVSSVWRAKFVQSCLRCRRRRPLADPSGHRVRLVPAFLALALCRSDDRRSCVGDPAHSPTTAIPLIARLAQRLAAPIAPRPRRQSAPVTRRRERDTAMLDL